MLAQNGIRLGKAFEQPVIDHRLRAFAGFLGRLEYGHERAAPGMPVLREER